MSFAVIFGSSMGSTEEAAGLIADSLGTKALNVSDCDANTLNSYDGLICGTSTWNDGELQDDWDSFDFDSLNLSGKTVALFGLGDSLSYSDSFCDGMGILYENFKKAGANIVGEVSTDGYEFDESRAVVNGKFVGLVLDYDNESEKSEDRISNWVSQIKKYFN
ncbi:flavodoxin FldA [Campylobacter corcagiensis]|uniref:Flavodoxin n=1 Tax=Campylobacter corcagiensis TaxID=1448857 RepID=A0A7M1LDF9_9BACT|nr:flavodoxin FldA [Campylobacter corcagiensis]QKF65275.1 flavodoxin [Campylobacter corcagiensis]QOQ86592.1 flavodoxin FldA [Campylobacter corcagiensis]